MLDVESIKKDFPILNRKINGKKIVYLDSAATTQKPTQVINAIKIFYENSNANVHRGIHTLSNEATEMYEYARKIIARFINAKKEEIIFVKNTTEAINLVRYAFASKKLRKNDEIIVSIMEHHSNFVPWLTLKNNSISIKIVDITDDFKLDEKNLFSLLSEKTRIVSITHCSNVLGSINNVKKICREVKNHNVIFMVDMAQSIPHISIDIKSIGCDFAFFSGHKMLGPTGIGVLYGKKELLEEMEPFMYGGEMIKNVTIKNVSFNDIPYKFEAGTPNIAGVIGLGAAVKYLKRIGMHNIRKHEREITKYMLDEFNKFNWIEIYGHMDLKKRCSIFSFNIKGVHSHDTAELLNEHAIAVRSGHHCAQPLHNRLGLNASTRASFYIYNSIEDVKKLIDILKRVKSVFL